MKDHIFISYARADAKDLALSLHDQLEANGFSAWLDNRDILPGDKWDMAIEKAIRSAWAMIFVMTSASLESEVCQDEWSMALTLGVPLIPLRAAAIDDSALPLRLHRRQYVDFTVGFERGMAALQERLRFFQTDEGEKEVASVRIEDKAEAAVSRSGAFTAQVLSQMGEVPHLPLKLVGREALQKQVTGFLEDGAQVLLQGLGGTGKTALAATIAQSWIGAGRGRVIWLKVGEADSNALFEALARPFGAHQAVAASEGAERAQIIQQALRESGVTLLVLDDAWNWPALNALLQAMPARLAVLVTSRQRFNLAQVIEVPDLPPESAVELLKLHGGRWVDDEAVARQVVEKLGCIAFAVEMAGRTMASNHWNVRELAQRLSVAPDMLSIPKAFQREGRAGLANLLEQNIASLPDSAREAYHAIGAFFAPTITPMMLMLYFAGEPNISEEQVQRAREYLPSEMQNTPDDEIRVILQRLFMKEIDTAPAKRALDILVSHGLAEYVPPTSTAVEHYRLHDLVFSFASGRALDYHRQRAVQTCINYTWCYKEASLANFAALRPELDNFLGASAWAMEDSSYEQVERFAWNLNGSGDGFLSLQGYYMHGMTLLKRAIDAATIRGDDYNRGAHMINMGLCYIGLGEYRPAIPYFEEALDIFGKIGDAWSRGIAMGNLGIAYRNLGQYEKALSYHEQALNIARELKNRQSEGNQLGSLGLVYDALGQYEKAIEYYQQTLDIARELNHKRMESKALGNLGNAYYSLNQYEKAIECHESALVISREIGDRSGEGNDLGNLGNAYADLGQYEKAIELHNQALVISRATGDRRSQANDLNNLGVTYEGQGNYQRALAYYRDALALYDELGLAQMGERTRKSIARVESKLSGRQTET